MVGESKGRKIVLEIKSDWEWLTPAQNDALFSHASNSLSENGFLGNLRASQVKVLKFHHVSHWTLNAELIATIAISWILSKFISTLRFLLQYLVI